MSKDTSDNDPKTTEVEDILNILTDAENCDDDDVITR